MSNRWYVITKKETRGPLTVEQIEHLYNSGRITLDHRVRRSGKSETRIVCSVRDLLQNNRVPPNSIPPSSFHHHHATQPPASESRSTPAHKINLGVSDDIRRLVAMTMIPGNGGPHSQPAPAPPPPSSHYRSDANQVNHIRPTTACWFVVSTIDDERRYGPFCLLDLKAMHQAGRIFDRQKITRKRSNGTWAKWYLIDIFTAAERMFSPQELNAAVQAHPTSVLQGGGSRFDDPWSRISPSRRSRATPSTFRKAWVGLRRALRKLKPAKAQLDGSMPKTMKNKWLIHLIGYTATLGIGGLAATFFVTDSGSVAAQIRFKVLGSSCPLGSVPIQSAALAKWARITPPRLKLTPLESCDGCTARGTFANGATAFFVPRSDGVGWHSLRQAIENGTPLCARRIGMHEGLPLVELE